MYARPAIDIRQLGGQRGVVALVRVPFAAEGPPDARREGGEDVVIGGGVVEGGPKNPQTTGPLTPGRTMGPAWMCALPRILVSIVGRLRPRDVDIEDRGVYVMNGAMGFEVSSVNVAVPKGSAGPRRWRNS